MHRLATLHACIALLAAFFMAPFQHVHPSERIGYEDQVDHEQSTVVHAHLFIVSNLLTSREAATIGDSHKTAWMLDTFTFMTQMAPPVPFWGRVTDDSIPLVPGWIFPHH